MSRWYHNQQGALVTEPTFRHYTVDEMTAEGRKAHRQQQERRETAPPYRTPQQQAEYEWDTNVDGAQRMARDIYTLARIGLFVASYALIVGVYLLVTGGDKVPLLWPLLLAAIVSSIASVYLLRQLR